MATNLNKLWIRGKEFLNCDYAILGGAMSWVSEHNLVSAISNAGAFGIIACSSMPPAILDQEIKKTKEKTNKSFGVNLIIMHPQLDELIEVCRKNSVTHLVLAGGIPNLKTITQAKEFAKVMAFVPTVALGKKLIRNGVDALVIEGMEAGGHIGPVSTSVLAQEILPALAKEVPIFVAGGIGRGEAIAAYLEMGAAGCQLGTRFVCAKESIAHPNFKRVFIKSAARHATASIQLDDNFPVIPVRAIENKATKDFLKVQRDVITSFYNNDISKEEAQLKIEHYWAGALRKAAIEGDIEHGSLMAGQSVGMVTCEQYTKEIIDELIIQAENYLAG